MHRTVLVALLTACAARAQDHKQGIESFVARSPTGYPWRNIICIVLDDVAQADLEDVRALGGTASLDALAAQGVTFSSMYANAVCAISRRSLMFGYFWNGGVGSEICGTPDAGTPPLSDISLAELLPDHQSCLIGKWHLGTNVTGGAWQCTPLTQGFDFWRAGTVGNLNGGACGGENYMNWVRADAWGGDTYVCQAIDVLDYEPYAVRDELRFGWPVTEGLKFGYVGMGLAHGPFHAPPRAALPVDYPPPTVNNLSRFHAMIAASSKMIGQMVAAVDLQYTQVWVIGDNGTPEQVAPEEGRAKGSTFERGIHVPCFALGAGIVNPGRVYTGLAHEVDIYATIAAFQGPGIPEGCDGVSLMPVLEDATPSPRAPIIVSSAGAGDLCAIMETPRMKLRRGFFGESLYDLDADPTEQTDLIDDETYVVEKATLQAFLDAFQAR